MKTYREDGCLGWPGSQVTVDTPDGVTKTIVRSGEAVNSLTHARWANGGPDGGGYGAFASHGGSPGMFAVVGMEGERSNAGVTSLDGKPSKRFRID